MKISSLNISEKKGVIKSPVNSIELNEKGITNDAHAGNWHRQVSILGSESIEKFSAEMGKVIKPGEFAENITLQGLGVTKVNPLDKFICNDIQLEVTQIGKKCHGSNCVIFRETGNCVMPKEGIFCRVLKGGTLKQGDEIIFQPKEYKVLVLTLSDRCYSGITKDTGGPKVVEKIKSLMDARERKYKIDKEILPDDPVLLTDKIKNALESTYDIIITTGGTGIGPGDIAPETIKPLLDKELPGIMDFIRLKYGSEKPNTLISRAIAGTKSNTLIFTLPGSLKAVTEYMEEINKVIFHCFYMLYSIDNH